ncbi:eukaryotic translation initiation factor 4 gamma-like isoform X2 [Anopheles stephensi]|uniref:eukaryotic translation initiation factor 4 gamma-like isoform X2 n=1 Tax=Anopheles stephensi TaxID=30069 RepID=UPI001658BEAC|nr:eukaryotic translation initiation factor 4 gamma-like isoform X2 [Anopheles stephensi]
MRELIDPASLPPIPATVFGTDNMSLQMSVVLVSMGMIMYGAALALELLGYASAPYLQMQLFTTGFGLLLTTLGIIANQLAQELVLAVRVLALIMLMSECFLGLMLLMAKFKRLQRLMARFRQSHQIHAEEGAPMLSYPGYGRVSVSNHDAMETTLGESYAYRIVQPGAVSANEIMIPPNVSIHSPPPSLASSKKDLSQGERASFQMVQVLDESTDKIPVGQPFCFKTPNPTPAMLADLLTSPVSNQSDGETFESTADKKESPVFTPSGSEPATTNPDPSTATADQQTAAKRQAARKTFRLSPSVMRKSDEERKEPNQSSPTVPFIPSSKDKKAIRPSTLNLPKTAMRIASFGILRNNMLPPDVTHQPKKEEDGVKTPDTPLSEKKPFPVERQPTPVADPVQEPTWSNPEPMPSTSRQDPSVSLAKESNYVMMSRIFS